MMHLTTDGLVLTPSSTKQLSMIGKVNPPFKAIQVVIKKCISQKMRSAFNSKVEESKSRLVYINREYDSSERFFLLYPTGVSVDFFPVDDNIIFLS